MKKSESLVRGFGMGYLMCYLSCWLMWSLRLILRPTPSLSSMIMENWFDAFHFSYGELGRMLLTVVRVFCFLRCAVTVACAPPAASQSCNVLAKLDTFQCTSFISVRRHLTRVRACIPIFAEKALWNRQSSS